MFFSTCDHVLFYWCVEIFFFAISFSPLLPLLLQIPFTSQTCSRLAPDCVGQGSPQGEHPPLAGLLIQSASNSELCFCPSSENFPFPVQSSLGEERSCSCTLKSQVLSLRMERLWCSGSHAILSMCLPLCLCPVQPHNNLSYFHIFQVALL